VKFPIRRRSWRGPSSLTSTRIHQQLQGDSTVTVFALKTLKTLGQVSKPHGAPTSSL